MSRQILPSELAEIVTALLVKPELIGSLDSTGQHQEFMRDIGQVVADHCGGDINGVSDPRVPDDNYLDDQYSAPMLSVSPNDSLASLNSNVWSAYDPDGWEDEDVDGIEAGTPLSAKEIVKQRAAIQSLLVGDTFEIPFTLKEQVGGSQSIKGVVSSDDLNISFKLTGGF